MGIDIYTILFFITQFVVFILALSIHEAAHAFAANKFGDPTAKMLGRLTLNPVKHVDPVGTLLMPLIAAITHFPVIGWAKPVPVNTYNLRDPKLDHAFIAGAGPLSNLLQAMFYTGVLWLIEPLSSGLIQGIITNSVSPLYWVHMIIYMACAAGIFVNLLLAVFNLIPIPPLDGGWIISGVLPDNASNFFMSIGQYGFIIIMALLWMGVLGQILYPVLNFFMGSMLPAQGVQIVGFIFSKI